MVSSFFTVIINVTFLVLKLSITSYKIIVTYGVNHMFVDTLRNNPCSKTILEVLWNTVPKNNFVNHRTVEIITKCNMGKLCCWRFNLQRVV